MVQISHKFNSLKVYTWRSHVHHAINIATFTAKPQDVHIIVEGQLKWNFFVT